MRSTTRTLLAALLASSHLTSACAATEYEDDEAQAIAVSSQQLRDASHTTWIRVNANGTIAQVQTTTGATFTSSRLSTGVYSVAGTAGADGPGARQLHVIAVGQDAVQCNLSSVNTPQVKCYGQTGLPADSGFVLINTNTAGTTAQGAFGVTGALPTSGTMSLGAGSSFSSSGQAVTVTNTGFGRWRFNMPGISRASKFAAITAISNSNVFCSFNTSADTANGFGNGFIDFSCRSGSTWAAVNNVGVAITVADSLAQGTGAGIILRGGAGSVTPISGSLFATRYSCSAPAVSNLFVGPGAYTTRVSNMPFPASFANVASFDTNSYCKVLSINLYPSPFNGAQVVTGCFNQTGWSDATRSVIISTNFNPPLC